MALVVAPQSVVMPKLYEKDFSHQQDELINVFLRMWDGKTLCCVINPKLAAITKIDYLTERVLQCYPYERNSFYFEIQGKPLCEKNCNSISWVNGSTVFVQYRNQGGCFMVSFTVLTIIMAAIVGSTCTCGLSLLVVPLLLPLLFILPLFCL